MMSQSRRRPICLDAVDPVTGKTCQVQISHGRMQAIATRTMGAAKECAFTVPYVLKNPTGIFEGLREDEDEDRGGVGWRCYCGIPPCAYHADGTDRPPYPNQLFLVFVNDEGVAYNWRWEKADEADPNLPQHHNARFKKRLS